MGEDTVSEENIMGFNKAPKGMPYLVLTDLD